MTVNRFFWVTQAFESTSGSMTNLVNGVNTMKTECNDTTLLGSFLENHDNPRFPSLTSDMSLTENAIAFTMLSDGIPIVYEGQEQHLDGSIIPSNREAIWLTGYNTSAPLYGFISTLNKLRSLAITQDSAYLTYKADVVYSDTSTVALRKGSTGTPVLSVFSNLGANGACYTLVLPSTDTGFSSNQALIEVLNCTSYETTADGDLSIAMAAGAARIFYPAAALQGSGICSSLTGEFLWCK